MDKPVLTAEQLADAIFEAEVKARKRSYEQLKSKCYQEISKMAADRNTECWVEITEDLLGGLEAVTEELRDLGYKFRFCGIKNSDGKFIADELMISLKHKMQDDE